ncbi:hypothetical protein [Nocardia sp. NPDC058705]
MTAVDGPLDSPSVAAAHCTALRISQGFSPSATGRPPQSTEVFVP